MYETEMSVVNKSELDVIEVPVGQKAAGYRFQGRVLR